MKSGFSSSIMVLRNRVVLRSEQWWNWVGRTSLHRVRSPVPKCISATWRIDLESAVVAEPQGKLRPFLEANWAVVNDQISVNKVEDGEDEGEIEQMVFPFHSYRFRFHSMYATVWESHKICGIEQMVFP